MQNVLNFKICWKFPIFDKILEIYTHYHKDTPTQVLSCETCENFKNIYFEEHLWTTASNQSNLEANVKIWQHVARIKILTWTFS